MAGAPHRYVIGLGANLGEKLVALRSALAGLGRLGRIVAVSGVYETAAVGPPQPDYLNAAVLLESTLEPSALLNELLAIERAHGRLRLERWGPRTLDLDLLWAGDVVLSTADLTLPHPELNRRPFALMPLLDVAPDARDPRSGHAYKESLSALDCRGVQRLEVVLGTLQGERNTQRV
jgi:2-amino-4-hydroxy-6-hydroxymethyldihydropteridine diphosphokinase